MSDIGERDWASKLVNSALEKLIAPHDSAEDHRQWWLSQMPIENDSPEAFKISEAAWIASAERSKR